MTIADLTMMGKETSQKWWWIDSNVASPRSPWLQYSLGELERKTKAMLKVIEEDADSFAQRAEMYYKKRPELINMVEDFYRAHRSLVEQYDQLKSETGGSRCRLLSLTSSLSVDFERGRRSRMSVMMDDQTCDCKSTASGRMGDDDHQAYDCKSTLSGGMDDDDHQHHQAYDCKSTMSGGMDDDDDHQTPYHCKSTLSRGMEDDDDHQASYDCKSTTSHSDVYDLEDSAAESEVDDPDEEILGHDDSLVVMDEIEEVGPERFGKSAAAALDEMTREWETRFASQNEEMKHLKEEMERVKEENRVQKEELKQKDEEKREVIRQLSLGMEMLRSENSELRKQQQQVPKEKRSSPFEFGKLKDSIFTKLFQGSPPISKASSRVAAAL